MDTNKILSADLLDLVFDNRNKDYGAYELRKNYQSRITKALDLYGCVCFAHIYRCSTGKQIKAKRKIVFCSFDEVTLARY